MKTLLERLLNLLEGQLGFYRSLFMVLKKERRAAIDSSYSELCRTTREKEEILLKIGRLEEDRINLMGHIAKSGGYASDGMNIVELSNVVEERYAGRLKRYHHKFIKVIQSIQSAHKLNRILLEHGAQLMKESILLLDNLINPNAVYHRGGKLEKGARGGKIFSSTV